MSELSLMLRMLSWLSANRATTVAEVARTFDLTHQRVFDLVDMARWSGAGEMYGELIEIEIFEDGDITVHNTVGINRPLQLDVRQASALLAGLEFLAEVPTDVDPASVRALIGKLRRVLPTTVPLAEVIVDEAQRANTDILREAIARKLQVEIVYVSPGAQHAPERTIEPWVMTTSEGMVFARGWCHSAGDVRSFRVDRIVSATLTNQTATVDADGMPGEQGRDSWPVVKMTVTIDHLGDFAPDTVLERAVEGKFAHLTVQVAGLEWLASVMLAAGGGIVVHNTPAVYEIARSMQAAWRGANQL